jgi:putative hemolysin
VGHIGLAVLLICFVSAAILFFSVIVNSLRTFSFARLQDAFKNGKGKADSENLIDHIVDNADRLTVAFSWYLLLAQAGLLLVLLSAFTTLWPKAEVRPHRVLEVYTVSFIVAMAILSIFSLAIPQAWAKYGGEKILCRTYKLCWLLAMGAFPVVAAQKGYNGFVRRLAGIADATPEEQLEEKHEEFLSELEHHRLEGAVDEEEQEMIENVLELSDSTADEIMTPRTDITAVEVKSDLQTVLDTIAAAGHTRVPVYKENIDNIVGLVYAKDLLDEIGKDPAGFKLHEKVREAFFVPETKPLRALLHEFQGQKLHIAIVLD